MLKHFSPRGTAAQHSADLRVVMVAETSQKNTYKQGVWQPHKGKVRKNPLKILLLFYDNKKPFSEGFKTMQRPSFLVLKYFNIIAFNE